MTRLVFRSETRVGTSRRGADRRPFTVRSRVSAGSIPSPIPAPVPVW
jgi:hypothetical protein